MRRKTKKQAEKQQGVFISKKLIIIAVIVIILVLAFFLWKGGLKIFKPGEAKKVEIKSGAEASQRLTEVAEDIKGVSDELDSLTKGFSSGP